MQSSPQGDLVSFMQSHQRAFAQQAQGGQSAAQMPSQQAQEAASHAMPAGAAEGDVLSALVQTGEPGSEGTGEAFGSCKTCVFVLERIKKGSNMLLPAICSELYHKYPDAYALCHQVLNALSINGNNVRYWLFEGTNQHAGCAGFRDERGCDRFGSDHGEPDDVDAQCSKTPFEHTGGRSSLPVCLWGSSLTFLSALCVCVVFPQVASSTRSIRFEQTLHRPSLAHISLNFLSLVSSSPLPRSPRPFCVPCLCVSLCVSVHELAVPIGGVCDDPTVQGVDQALPLARHVLRAQGPVGRAVLPGAAHGEPVRPTHTLMLESSASQFRWPAAAPELHAHLVVLACVPVSLCSFVDAAAGGDAGGDAAGADAAGADGGEAAGADGGEAAPEEAAAE